MIQLIRNRDFYGLGLYLLLAVLIGYQQMVSPAIGVLILIVIAEFFFVKKFKFTFNKYTALFFGLYCLYLIGLMWSDHVDIGLKLLEYKMSYFIFPILFLLHKSETRFWMVIKGFILGVFILCFRFYFAMFFPNGEVLPGYEISRVVLDLHPTYSSMYLTIAIFILFYGYFSKKTDWKLILIIPLAGVLIYPIIAMNSFAAILFLGICFVCVFAFFVFKYLKWAGLIGFLVIVPFVFYYALTKIEALKYDVEMVDNVWKDIKKGKNHFIENNKMADSGTKERALLWIISLEIIAENPFGVGTGDIDFYLLEKCAKYDMKLLQELNLNPHNQFLQIGIDIGWIGILYLLFLLAFLFYFGLKQKNYLLSFIISVLSFNALFESVLQRQSGIVFFSVLICLVLVYNNQIAEKIESRDE